MIRLIKNDIESTYFVTSANWEVCCVASSFDEASSKGLSQVLAEFGKECELSPAIIVVNASAYSLNFSDIHSKIYSTSKVLSDIGMHNLAKKIKKVIPES